MNTVWGDHDLPKRIDSFIGGRDFRCYEWLGCHPAGDGGYTFRVWAPQAQAVSLVGDFCGWDPSVQPMERVSDGVWECSLQAEAYSAYGYHILSADGQAVIQNDPFATLSTPDGCVVGVPSYSHRAAHCLSKRPINVYEVCLAGWRRFADGQVFSYEALATELIPYVRDMGFTHLRLMGLAQGLLPDPRHGNTDAFMAFVDACHQAGLGVLVDWQPPEDASLPSLSAALSRAMYWWSTCSVDGFWLSVEDADSEAVERFHGLSPLTLLLQTSAGDVAPPSGRSLLAGMAGDAEQQFAAVRNLLSYQLLLPITHHLMMGDEFGRQRPWDPDGGLDWLLLDYESHRMLRHYVSTLNNLYLDTPSLWSGAVWLPESGVLVARPEKDLLAVCNTTPFLLEQIAVGVSDNTPWHEWFNSDWAEFGGSNRRVTVWQPCLSQEEGYPYTIQFNIPPLTTVFLRRT